MVIVYPEGVFYIHVHETDVIEIVEEHLYKGRIVKTAGKELALVLEEKGYDWIKQEIEE